jgi:hypothetical protein
MTELIQHIPNKIISIHQPNYIPWLGYFYKIYQSEVFVFLDDVQYSNNAMHDFHYVKNTLGRFRLKVPVRVRFGDKIKDVILNNNINWRENHLKQIEMNYKKAPYYKEVYLDIAKVFEANDNELSTLNIRLIKLISQKFGFNAEFITSSELINSDNDKNERIFNICRQLEASVYYSGIGATVYQNENDFKERGIELRYSTFKPFKYPQFWGEFESNISILDYLMHCGYDWNLVLSKQS